VWCRKQGKSQKGYKGLKIDSDKKRGPSKFRILSIDEKSIFTSNLVNSSSPPPKNQLREYIMPSYLNTPQKPWLEAINGEPSIIWSAVYSPDTLARFYNVDNVNSNNEESPIDKGMKCPFTTKGKGKGAYKFNLRDSVSKQEYMFRNLVMQSRRYQWDLGFAYFDRTSPTLNVYKRQSQAIQLRILENEKRRQQREIKQQWLLRLRKR